VCDKKVVVGRGGFFSPPRGLLFWGFFLARDFFFLVFYVSLGPLWGALLSFAVAHPRLFL